MKEGERNLKEVEREGRTRERMKWRERERRKKEGVKERDQAVNSVIPSSLGS